MQPNLINSIPQFAVDFENSKSNNKIDRVSDARPVCMFAKHTVESDFAVISGRATRDECFGLKYSWLYRQSRLAYYICETNLPRFADKTRQSRLTAQRFLLRPLRTFMIFRSANLLSLSVWGAALVCICNIGASPHVVASMPIVTVQGDITSPEESNPETSRQHDADLKKRIKAIALAAAGVICLLAILFGYLRMDHATRGFYSGRLQSVAVVCVILILVAGFLIWKLFS